MNVPINAERLRRSLPDIVKRVRRGSCFTVIYRRRPAFQIVPVNDAEQSRVALDEDTLYRARPVGRSRDGRTAANHDPQLY